MILKVNIKHADVILPEYTHARFIVTAGDVIHSFACPSLGIKVDAYPGRLSDKMCAQQSGEIPVGYSVDLTLPACAMEVIPWCRGAGTMNNNHYSRERVVELE